MGRRPLPSCYHTLPRENPEPWEADGGEEDLERWERESSLVYRHCPHEFRRGGSPAVLRRRDRCRSVLGCRHCWWRACEYRA
jgi:hypothetical protein